uniref:Uncharacterized protein n=1 Tax=Sus scrofa TaxID=9823 RepID=A0A4X1V1N8_PIG
GGWHGNINLSQVYFVVHRWEHDWDRKRKLFTVNFISWTFTKQCFLINFSSSRNFNSRVQTIDFKTLHFHSFSASLK